MGFWAEDEAVDDEEAICDEVLSFVDRTGVRNEALEGGAASGCCKRADEDVEATGLEGVMVVLGVLVSGDLNGLGRLGSIFWDFDLSIKGEMNVEDLFEDDSGVKPEALVKLLDSCDADANPEP